MWSNPVTRKELLLKLENAGCYRDDLEKLQELINAKNSDLFDVLEYIAYAKPPISRVARVQTNKENIFNKLNSNQKKFVDYILRNYVRVGIDELDIEKLDTIVNAKYGGILDAKKELGEIKDIKNTFIDFQKHLYVNTSNI